MDGRNRDADFDVPKQKAETLIRPDSNKQPQIAYAMVLWYTNQPNENVIFLILLIFLHFTMKFYNICWQIVFAYGNIKSV